MTDPDASAAIAALVRTHLEVKRNLTLDLLRAITAEHDGLSGHVVFANGFGAEDMVLTDLILGAHLPIGIFTLDTGRLPAETYALMQQVEQRYATRLMTYSPAPDAVAAYVRAHGADAFYDSVALRHACCRIRLVEPLRRALAGKRAWLTGMRATQSAARAELPLREFDADHGLERYNPLAEWSEADVWAYIRLFDVPYNALHDRFYPSIGCAPCTRAISTGETYRAGRWWWEGAGHHECGLLVKE